MVVQVFRVRGTRPFVFVVKLLTYTKFPTSGRFVSFTVRNCPVPAVVSQEIVSSFGHTVDNGLFLSEFEAADYRGALW